MPTLTVDLNREGVHAVEAPDEFEADGTFSVELDNHGRPTHVHLHLDDALSTVASLGVGNHYVEADATRLVEVRAIDASEPVTGRLKLVAGHGAETEYVRVTVTPPAADRSPVDVDESLAEPPRPEPQPTLAERATDRFAERDVDAGTAAALAFAALAVLVAVAVGLAIGSPAVLFGVGVVIGTAVVAAFLLVR